MPTGVVHLRVAGSLRLFLRRPTHPAGGDLDPEARACVDVEHDGTSTLGHLVQSVGLPLTEVGELSVNRRPVGAGIRDLAGATVDIGAPHRPQRLRGWPRLVLDVHLGSLARRLQLLGIDAAYSDHATDDELVEIACADDRILLTRDRGILFRRAVRDRAAFVRGDRTDVQTTDLLDRFAPPLAPFSRCVACNGALTRVAKDDVIAQLRPGTLRTYDTFSRCTSCYRVYWRGAHTAGLDAAVMAGLAGMRSDDNDLIS